MIVPFGEFAPDLPALGNAGLTVARNVLPLAGGYGAIPSLSAFSGALSAYARGFLSATDRNGDHYSYAGDASKLYRLSGTTWTDASKVGGYAVASDDQWEMVAYNNQLIATNVSDPVQALTLGGTTFADLIGSTRQPKARHLDVVRGSFLVLGSTSDSVDGERPARVWWPAANDETDFDPSAATLCGFQDLDEQHGGVTRVVGGEYGTIFQENAITRMTFVGSPIKFQFDELEINRGAWAPYATARVGGTVFYLARDGFYAHALGAGASQPIGANKVNEFFFADLSAPDKQRISCAADVTRTLVFWAYPGAGNTSGRPNKLLIYNWTLGRWSYAEVETELLAAFLSSGYTLEDLDAISASLDALPASLDSALWKGGQFTFGAFDTAHKLALFSGSAMAGLIETGEVQLVEGRRAILKEARPLIDGAATVAIGTRDAQSDAVSWTGNVSVGAAGFAPFRANGRYHRARLTTSGAFTKAMGLDIEAAQAGRR